MGFSLCEHKSFPRCRLVAKSPVNRAPFPRLRKFRISSGSVLLSILANRGSISICRVAYPKTDEASREERPVETALIQLTVETRMITQRATSLAIKLCLGGVLALSRCRQSSVLSGRLISNRSLPSEGRQ